MFRRQFVRWAAVFGAGVTTIATAGAKETKTVRYRVKGFSCIACAVGLDTMLQKQHGVVSSESTYPEGIVSIRFGTRLVSEESLKTFIAEKGFTVLEEPAS